MRKNMKKSRFAFPLIALVVCLVLVTGSTFSLFTSQTGVNIAVTSGTVKMTALIDNTSLVLSSKGVDRIDENKLTFENGGTASLTTKDGYPYLELVNITPGDSVAFEIDLKNESNVDLQYRVTWFVESTNPTVVDEETYDLYDVLVAEADGVAISNGTSQWTLWQPTSEAGKMEKTIKVSITFPMGTLAQLEEYKNYMGQTVNIGFTVEAVQANGTVEYSETAYIDDATGLHAAINAGATEIILNKDIDLDATIEIGELNNINLYLAGNSITNLNGDAIENNGTLIVYPGAYVATYSLRSAPVVGSIISGNGSAIVNNGTLTIHGGNIEAPKSEVAIENNGTATVNAAAITGSVVSSGTLTLENSEITAEGEQAAISTEGTGSVTVNGGTYTNKAENGVVVSGNVKVDGGHFDGAFESAEGSTPVINGGTFTDTSASDFVAGDNILGDKDGDGKFEIGLPTEFGMVATVNGNYYDSLSEAFAKANTGDTVTFIADVEEVDGILISDKNLTVDLAGYTFTVSEGASVSNRVFKIIGNSVVTIKNGTLKATGNAYGTIRTEGAANVTLDKLSLYNYRGGGLNVKAVTGTTVTINNCEIYSQYGGGVEASGGNIVLNDTKIDQQGVYDNGWYSVAMEINGGGKITVNSGEYYGKAIETDANASRGNAIAFILSSGGTLEINGGTFTGIVAETATAANFCGLIYADKAAVVNINGGTFNSNGAILDMRNNAGTLPNPVATLCGGTFSADPRVSGLYASNLIVVGEGYAVVEDGDVYRVTTPVAKVGDNVYYTIDEAIANWTNNTTLTLLSDVTLSDTVKIKSTEHHILNLGTYTLYAAEGKNAFEIVACGTGSAERFAITINADATNPGGINAGKKSIVFYDYSKGETTGEDRPIICVNGGVFTASTSTLTFGGNVAGFHTVGSAARKCATYQFNGGTFNCSVLGSGKSKMIIKGGVFNYAISSQGDSTANRIISGGKFKNIGFMTADSNNTKFVIGSAMYVLDKGVYVDDDGYIVVGGDVITEAGDRFEVSSKASVWSSYLQYSSANENGLYYTSAEYALANKASTAFTVYTDEIDLTGINYKGTLTISADLTITFAEGTTTAWTVVDTNGNEITGTDSVVDGVVTRTYTVA